MADKDRPTPDELQKVNLAEPTDERGVDLSEHVRKGTDRFPVVNMAPEDVQPAVSADPPAAPPAPEGND